MNSTFQLTVDSDGIAKLLFDLPGEKVNKMSVETLEALEKILDDIKDRKDIKALVILSGKKDIFIAGADIRQFEPAFKDPALGRKIIETGQRTFNKLSKLPFPTIAVIDGVCLGGGLELALACTYRIVTDNPKTSLGLPETQLGIIPGWGGTQRLPRLVGLQKGTEMIVSGKKEKGVKAFKIHLADAISAPEFLESATREFIASVLKPGGKEKIFAKRNNGGVQSLLLEKNPLGRNFLFSQFRKGILSKTKGFYPAPLLALDVIQETCTLPLEQGLKIEADAFLKNAEKNVDIAKNLIGIFFAQDFLKKSGGYSGTLPKGAETKSAAVIGAGTMGGGIAWLFANAFIPVRLKDVNWDAIGKGIGASWDVFRKFVRDKRTTPSDASLKFHEISWTLDYSGFGKKDFVIESAVENLDLKRKIYAELEAALPPDAIIATNTSSLTIRDLAKDLKHPERFIGMHFFNPATRMPLVEIIPGKDTTPEVIAKTIELAKKLGKVPLVVGDCNGFLVNRIFLMAAYEAFSFLQEGVSIEQLDKAMLDFGMPMGSCELIDEVGIDVTYKVAKVFEAAYGERMNVPPLLAKIHEAKLLGKKGGKGFYIYSGKNKTLNPEAVKIVKSFGGNKTYSDQEIQNRILLSMINEASRCLEEKIVTDPASVDLAMIMGTGFPPFRGGLLAYADKIGLPMVNQKLNEYAKINKARFEPTKQIESLATSNQSFYKT